MNSLISTLTSVVLNKFVLMIVVVSFLLNMGMNITEKWAIGIIPATAQELLDLQSCADQSNNQNLQDLVLASIAKPISKDQANDLLKQCSK